ncbi:MAG: ATP-binding protein [Verrucomicrobia bacterium]|nr:MAG: ATP-binding protein [Verrucomicrobiota bacterium]
MKFSYSNNIAELKKLASDIEVFAETFQLEPKVIYALNLCLDEILTNIISYGLKDQKDHPTIELELTRDNNQITATISDPGIPFNPLKALQTVPDTSSKIEDRCIGGLGVYFLEQYMDNVQYSRKDNLNVLTLTKNI